MTNANATEHLLPGGYLRTSGAQIVSASTGVPVRLAGVNWYGAECNTLVPGGLDVRPATAIASTIRSLGFNTVRIPYCVQGVLQNPRVHTTYVSQDERLNDGTKTVLDVLTTVVQDLGAEGLKVILDSHRSGPGWSSQQNGLWYTQYWSTDQWCQAWTEILRVLGPLTDPGGNPIVIGCDLRNEPWNDPPRDSRAWPANGGAVWRLDMDRKLASYSHDDTAGISRDWTGAAVDCADNVVHAYNSNLLVFVEGVRSHPDGPRSNGNSYWPGGNLTGVIQEGHVLQIRHQDRLVYSVHDYGPDIAPNLPWCRGTTSMQIRDQCYRIWDATWGAITRGWHDRNGMYQAPVPVWIGEFGTQNWGRDASLPLDQQKPYDYYVYPNVTNTFDSNPANTPYRQGAWFASLVQYIHDHSVGDGTNSMHWCYWGINGTQSYAPSRTEGATEYYGILAPDWQNISHPGLYGQLQRIQ